MRNVLSVLIVLLLFATASGQMNLYLEMSIPVNTKSVTALATSRDGRFLAYGTHEGGICLYDLEADKEIHYLKRHRKQVRSLLFDRANRYLISGGSDKRIYVSDVVSGRINHELKEFSDKVTTMDLSPDDRFLAVGGERKEIYIYQLPSGSLLGKLRGHKKDIIFVSFSKAGNELLSIGEDEQMIFWDVGGMRSVRRSEVETSTMKNTDIDIASALASHDKHFVVMGVIERGMMRQGSAVRITRNMPGRGPLGTPPLGVELNPGQQVFSYLFSFYDWNTGRWLEDLNLNGKTLEVMALTPDKRYLIADNSTLQEDRIAIISTDRGVIEGTRTIDGNISAIDISQDGRWLTVAYTRSREYRQSEISVWKLSGISGYERFAEQTLQSKSPTGLGSTIQIVGPDEPLIQVGERHVVAVLYFDSVGVSNEIAKTATYLLEGSLANSHHVKLVERNQIDNIISELKYQQSGLTVDQAAEIGRHLGAEYVVIGSVNKLGSTLIIIAKLVEVESGGIHGSRQVKCTNATIEDAADMVAVLALAIAKY